MSVGVANSRVFPALVVNLVLVRRFLVVLVSVSRVEHFCFIEQFVMEAKRLFVLAIHGAWSSWCHSGNWKSSEFYSSGEIIIF
jgi:hypothetical protein